MIVQPIVLLARTLNHYCVYFLLFILRLFIIASFFTNKMTLKGSLVPIAITMVLKKVVPK